MGGVEGEPGEAPSARPGRPADLSLPSAGRSAGRVRSCSSCRAGRWRAACPSPEGPVQRKAGAWCPERLLTINHLQSSLCQRDASGCVSPSVPGPDLSGLRRAGAGRWRGSARGVPYPTRDCGRRGGDVLRREACFSFITIYGSPTCVCDLSLTQILFCGL